MYQILISTRTKGPAHNFILQEDDLQLRQILLKTAQILKTEKLYSINLQFTEISLIYTKNGRNVYQFAPHQSLTLSHYESIKSSFKFDKIFYFQISERFFDPTRKYVNSTLPSSDSFNNCIIQPTISPHAPIEQILSKVHPIPLLINQQLTRKYYNEYLDTNNTNITCRIVKTTQISGIAENDPDKPNFCFCFEFIIRVPYLRFITFPIQKITDLIVFLLVRLNFLNFSSQESFQTEKKHINQPVLAMRFPLFPFLPQLLFTACFQTLLLYSTGIYKNSNYVKIGENVLKTYIINCLLKLIFFTNSVILPPKIIYQIFRILDPLGQHNRKFHYLYDEVFRADTEIRNRGGFNRNQGAEQLKKVGKDFGVEFQVRVIDVVRVVALSFNPWYKIGE